MKVTTLSKSQLRRMRKKVGKGQMTVAEAQAANSLNDEQTAAAFFWMNPSDLPKAPLATATKTKPVPEVKVKVSEVKTKATKAPTMTFAIAEQVRADKATMTYKQLKEKYGKAESTLRDIVKGRTWKAEA